MFFRDFFVEDLAHASYIIGCEKTKKAAVVDPQRDVSGYIALAQTHGFAITHILETHLHADFVSGHLELAQRTGAKIYMPKASNAAYPHERVADGDEFSIGAIKVKVLATPGHTPESICYVVFAAQNSSTPELVFTGDTLFVGSVGRPDLFGEQRARELAEQLYESIQSKLFSLPDNTMVYPAHGAGSFCGAGLSDQRCGAMGREKSLNQAIAGKSKKQFVNDLMNNLPQTPNYFHRSAEINRSGPKILGEKIPGSSLSAQEVAGWLETGATVLDTRSAKEYGNAHIPNSVHIALGGQFTPWVGWVTKAENPFIFVLADPNDYSNVSWRLLRIGYDKICGYLEGGMNAWRCKSHEVDILPQISVEELHRLLSSPAEKPTVLDVRTNQEWQSGHIAGAKHLPANMVEQTSSFDQNKTMAVICGGGFRSSIAASLLAKKGYRNLINVTGGMAAWRRAKLPLNETTA